MIKRVYWGFSYLGLMTIWASFIMGFRHSDDAPIGNLWFNLAIYAAFIAVHIALTMPAVKTALYGSLAGTPFERRIYIVITIVTWVLVYWLHKPIAGFAWTAPAWLSMSASAPCLCRLSASLNSPRLPRSISSWESPTPACLIPWAAKHR